MFHRNEPRRPAPAARRIGGASLAATALFIGLNIAPLAEAAQTAQGSSVTLQSSMPVARPEFPVPTDKNVIFYIQRSSNSNTVVYTANLRKDGSIDPNEPVKAFWRRFNTSGERKALSFLEDRMAYGVRARKGNAPGEYKVTFVALPGRTATLRQAADGSIEVTLGMGKYEATPAYAYVEVKDGGVMPKVERVRLYGRDQASGKAVVETIRVGGG